MTFSLPRRGFVKAAGSALLLPAFDFFHPAFAADGEVVADTKYGKVSGVRVRDSSVFKGIPYARTAKRLMPPAAPETWAGIKATTQFGPRAVQGNTLAADMSETCQFLNVWTPACDSRKRPVMVWLHGGGFMNGSANTDAYDGTDLNREGDVVVVTLNHRLGAFGYLHVASAGKDYATSGCVGMLDIVAALRWVKENIDGFGGDPKNVTIFGESGGGGKVLALMTMPSAQGLFHRAICQSGALLRTAITPEEGLKTTRDILNEMNLNESQLDRLLEAPVDLLLKAQAAVLGRMGTPGSGGSAAQRPFSPIIDGREMPEQPFDPRAPRISSHVPLMIGTNKEETRFFFVTTPKLYALDESELKPRIQALLGDQTDEVLSLYKKTRPQATATDLFFAISTAQMYWYTSTRAAERKARLRGAPVYMYQFAYEGTQTGGNPPVALKAAHSLEIPFAFAHPRPNKDNVVPAHEQQLAKQMSHAWIAFARSGNPNHAGLPKWPAYDVKRRATMVFDSPCSIANDPHPEERRLWERLLAKA